LTKEVDFELSFLWFTFNKGSWLEKVCRILFASRVKGVSAITRLRSRWHS